MPYDVSITEQDGVLRADVSGQRLVEDSRLLWPRLAEEARARGIGHILAILRLTGRMSTIEMYDVASHLDEFHEKPVLRLAVVDLNPESLPDNMFGSTVAINRGISVEIFDNVEDAERWLLGSED